MEIALNLDRQEKELMAEMGTETPEYQKFSREGSINVGLSGDFSANVLQEALDKVWNLKCEDTRRSDLKSVVEAAPTAEQGYLCHLEDHWIALRRLESDGSWWNLNSLEDAPTHLSPLYLGVFLKQLQLEGWTLYVVRGEYPQTPLNHSASSWRFVGDASSSPTAKPGAIDNDEEQFQKELEAAIAASMGGTENTTHQTQPSAPQAPATPPNEEDIEDEELRLAILLSKQDN